MQHGRAIGQTEDNLSLRRSASPHWPGERHPTRWDVHDANQNPASTFLERFRAALLHHEGVLASSSPTDDVLADSPSVADALEHIGTQGPTATYTYPMVLLSDAPTIPSEDELAQLQSIFPASFGRHILLDALDVLDPTQASMPPYFKIALACLSSATSSVTSAAGHINGITTLQPEASSALFFASINLLSVMLEVDNREARLIEAVVAMALLVTYGMLSADIKAKRLSSAFLGGVATISRRIHLTDGYLPFYTSPEPAERNSGMKSSVMTYMLLNDVIHAVQLGAPPVYSTSELLIKMPSSNYHFRPIYKSLIRGSPQLPKDLQTREDALLLLVALLSDILYLQRCNLSTYSAPAYRDPVVDESGIADEAPLRNPYAPLSLRSELARLSSEILDALNRWEQHFLLEQVGHDIYALYYFCTLHLLCTNLWELRHLADYVAMKATPGNGTINSTTVVHARQLNIPDKALDLAWLVLDNCDVRSEPPERKMAIWLPAILYTSALVVWQKVRERSSTEIKYGTLRTLNMFKQDLEQLPWPCCSEMMLTLDNLMRR